MNKEIAKHKKNINEKAKIKKTLDVMEKECKPSTSRQPFYWRKRDQSFGYPKDLRNPARH